MEKLNLKDLNKFGPKLEQSFDPIALGKLKADSYNATDGNLTGMDCIKCRNRGNIAYPKEDGNVGIVECECMVPRRSIWHMERHGLKTIIQEMTFDNFRPEQPWQQTIKTKAMNYAEHMHGWLLACGQVGSGKTHLCTAVCHHRLQKGDGVHYMPWRDEIVTLKSLPIDSDERAKLFTKLKSAQILYIDDLYKSGVNADGSLNLTGPDISITFEIVNYRYVNNLATIVSTEKTPKELMNIDEATASRIIERAKNNILNIARDPHRNYRLKDVVAI